MTKYDEFLQWLSKKTDNGHWFSFEKIGTQQPWSVKMDTPDTII